MVEVVDTSFQNRNYDTLPPILEWLNSEAPCFPLRGDQIKLLFRPDEFYSSLIESSCRAKRRITFAALYIGTGSLEHELVKVLNNRLTECGNELRVIILLDAVRASRDHSARTVLLPLIRDHPHCQVSLYHTPELRGNWLRLLPSRINEMFGLQHVKLYIFDNDIIVSGANLTNEYFTNRQDRYMVISCCKQLADFCQGLIEQISSVSLKLTEENTIITKSPNLHPQLTPRRQYEEHARNAIWGYYKQATQDANFSPKSGDDTWLFPLLQLPPFKVLQESCVTQTILESAHHQSTVHFTTPYFNMPEEYIQSFLHKCKASFNILIPHPTASDFFGARGFAGQIPSLYHVLASSFMQRVHSSGEDKRFCFKEFHHTNGSYHSKGIWITAPREKYPYLTIIGSSNFNYRSVKRDLECQMVIVTNNNYLRESLNKEKNLLYKHGVPFSQKMSVRPDRKPKFWQHLFLWVFKSYL